MPEHATIAAVTAIRLPTTVEAVDGKDRDSRVVVARPTMVSEDKADLVLMIAISMASKVIAGRSILFVPIRDHHYHTRALIAE